MLEWGLTPEQFYSIDIEHIRKMHDYREAKAKAEEIIYKRKR